MTMSDILFDTPYWLLGLIAVAAMALFVAGNNRQDKTLKRLSAAAVALGVVLFGLSLAVETEREKVTSLTRNFVSAVEKKDSAAAEKLLHPAATLLWMRKPDVVKAIATAADDYGISSINIGSMDVKSTGDTVVAVISVGAQMEKGGYSGAVPSTWSITWVRSPAGDWQAKYITAIHLPMPVYLATLLARFRR